MLQVEPHHNYHVFSIPSHKDSGKLYHLIATQYDSAAYNSLFVAEQVMQPFSQTKSSLTSKTKDLTVRGTIVYE